MKQQLHRPIKPNGTGPHSQLALLSALLFVLSSTNLSAQTSTDQNYIKTTTYKAPDTTSISNPDSPDVAVEITYIDGLGRPKQKIAHNQSGNGDDLVTHIGYDGFGRQPKEFLPYERSSSLVFDANGEANTTTYYTTGAPSPTSNPFTEKVFENSALNRVLEQAAPGDPWAMANGHTVKFSYETNTANEVHHFSVVLGGDDPQLHYDGKYPEGQLRKNVVKDENWQPGDGSKGTTVQFTDKLGRMVLKRTFDVPIGQNKTSTGTITLDTYYVYDVYGNLSFVLPPKLSDQIVSGGSLVGNHQDLLDVLGYQYTYDYRNRLIHKKIPGKHREYMVYDMLDRLIATGPVLSPFGDEQEGWLHTKYDKFDRVVYTFWQQGVASNQEQLNMTNQLPTYLSEVRISGTNTVNGVTFSYTNQVAPTSGYHILTVNYYDDYGYTGAPDPIPATVAEGQSAVYYNNASQKPKGLPTGSWTRAVETAGQHNAITSYSLYDEKARPIRVKSTNSAGGYTQTDTKFDFIGNPLETITKHKKDAAAQVLVLTDAFTYTAQSRPASHTHKIGNGTPQLLALNHYDALGRVEYKNVGGAGTIGATPLQKVDYRYNARGWMTDINNVASLAQPGDPQDLFAFKLHYTTVDDNINGTVVPLYNGNIAETFWRTSSDNIKRKYGYSYDYGNRLLDAYYQLPGTAVPRADSYSTHYSYDRNGNILSLQRNGEQDLANSVIPIDDLAYGYDGGNQLTKVRDDENFSAGYNDAHTAANEDDFEYDGYGNLTVDRDKDIASVKYNHLNLPIKITFGSGGKIEYFYDATGIKLKKKVTDGSTITNTEYQDGFQYTNGALDFFPTAEGYVKVLSGLGTTAYKYVFNYVDHLGNIRMSYAQDPQNSNQLAILEENHYYPYGLKHKGYNGNHQVWEIGTGGVVTLTPVNPFLGDSYKYKFGGKEYQDEFDINTYDFGARNYDPALGRWMNIDPLAETMRRYSPYNYAFNNPIFFIDPDGMMATDSFGMGTNTAAVESYDFGSGNESGALKSGGGEDKIKATFSSENAKTKTSDVVKGATGGMYQTTTNSEGNLELERTGVQGPLTKEQQAFVDNFNEIADSPETVEISISESSEKTLVGNFKTGDVDIDDVGKYGNGPYETAGGALSTELREQYMKQVEGYKDHNSVHGSAVRNAQNPVNGRLNGGINYSRTQFSNGTGVIYTTSKNNAGSNPVSVKATVINNNNVIKVQQ